MLSLIFVFLISEQTESPQSEWRSPENPAVKRFQEVIESNLKNEAGDIQETLINLRARLALAEKRRDEIVAQQAAEDQPKKPQSLKSIQAEIDHYNKLISGKEMQVLREKKKENKRKK